MNEEEKTQKNLLRNDKRIMITGQMLLLINNLLLVIASLSYILTSTVFSGVRCICAWDYIPLTVPYVNIPITITGIVLLAIVLMNFNKKINWNNKKKTYILISIVSIIAIIAKSTIIMGIISHQISFPTKVFKNMYKVFFVGEVIAAGTIALLYGIQGRLYSKQAEENTILAKKMRMPFVNYFYYCVWVITFLVTIILVREVVNPSFMFERQVLAFGIGLLFYSIIGVATIIEQVTKQRKLLKTIKTKSTENT